MMSKIIADLCSNHNGRRELMAEMVKQAAAAGVDAVKAQSYKAEKLRQDWPDYKKAYKYYKQRELSEDDHYFLLEQCKNNNVEFTTTAFDVEAVTFLATLGLERIKIGSADCNSWALIRKCLDKFEHVLISTGMHSIAEVTKLKNYLGSAKRRVTVLHCVSLYPTPPDKVVMLRLGRLLQEFDSVGYSDHTLGTDAAKLALCLGVACVEKHFTINRRLAGKDQKLSGTPAEFTDIAQWRDKVQTMMYSPDTFPDSGARHYIGRFGNNA